MSKEIQRNSNVSKKISINLLEKPQLILMDYEVSSYNFGELNIYSLDNVSNHDFLTHTTNLETIGYIFDFMTIRASSLTNAKLNDSAEKERLGVEEFAGSKFIVCFSHERFETVNMWNLYGGTKKEEKIMLKFRNFSDDIASYIHTDYCLIEKGKLFFESTEFKNTINNNGLLGQKLNLPKINTDYNLRTCVDLISIFDIEYLAHDHNVFSTSYSDEATLSFTNDSPIEVTSYKPSVLGRFKSEPWSTEKETRLLLSLQDQKCNEFNFIDVRLKDEFFRNLTIVLSPWAEMGLRESIENIIINSPLNEEIKSTIKIQDSILKNTINL